MAQVRRRGQRPGSPHGTNGAADGASGAAFSTAWLLCVGLVLISMTANAISVGADNPGWEPWEPWVLEATSNLVLGALAFIPGRAVGMARGLNPRTALLHAAAFLAYTLVHVLVMMGLRKAAFGVMGESYLVGSLPGRLLYEGPKDVVSYAIFATLFWFAARRGKTGEAPRVDIHDGGRLIRTTPSDILAAVSAGNYVEFHLADGRRPLMRTTLAKVEATLGPHGFLRIHRSWLINEARVTAMEAQGSGDWTVSLSTLSAPLSRRYPGALARLRRN